MSALLGAVGDNRLMPVPETSVLVINAGNGYVRQNQSWIVSRVVRDYEYWKDPRIDRVEESVLKQLQKVEHSTAKEENREPKSIRTALRLAIYEAMESTGTIRHDLIWWSGVVVMVVQLAIAAIPWAIYREWVIFFITGIGTLLAIAGGTLPQWSEEKWACRRKSDKSVVLTTGNGSHDAMVVIGNGHGFDLEDLASSYRLPGHPLRTRIFSFLLAVAWTALLVCVAGYRQHTWYLLAVGGIGIVHNVVVAGAPRKPGSFGIHLTYQQTIVDRKVMSVLATAETHYPRLGLSLLSTFFPGDLRAREKHFWAYAKRRAHAYEQDHTLHFMPELVGDEDIPETGFLGLETS